MCLYDFKAKAQDGGDEETHSLFLISRKGETTARFEPAASLKDVKAKVEEVL